MKREEFNQIALTIVLVETFSLLIICISTLSLNIYSFRSKSKILFDTLRNDYINGDNRSLNQKMKVAISQYDFVTIELINGQSLSRNRRTFELEMFDFSTDYPVLANTSDENSKISIFRFKTSLSKSIIESFLVWLLVSLIVVFSVPFIRRRVERETERRHELMRREYEYKIARQVAHDIRSPLSALRVGIAHIYGDADAKELILKSCDRISKIADDLLHACKTPNSSEEMAFEVEKFCLKLAIQEIVSEKIISNEIPICMNLLDIDNPYLVFGNRQAFLRSISNILDNSLEALGTSQNGKIEIFLRVNGDIVSVTIADNGPGVPAEIIEKICVEGATFGKTNGNGLGLYYAKSIIEAMGGKIHIQSREGLGTNVSVHIPIAQYNLDFKSSNSFTENTKQIRA